MNKIFSRVSLDEQETIIHYDYKERMVNIYTSRSNCYNKFCKILGLPSKGSVAGANWYISFDNRELIKKCIGIEKSLPRKATKKQNKT